MLISARKRIPQICMEQCHNLPTETSTINKLHQYNFSSKQNQLVIQDTNIVKGLFLCIVLSFAAFIIQL